MSSQVQSKMSHEGNCRVPVIVFRGGDYTCLEAGSGSSGRDMSERANAFPGRVEATR